MSNTDIKLSFDPEYISEIHENFNTFLLYLDECYKNRFFDVFTYTVLIEKVSSARDYLSTVQYIIENYDDKHPLDKLMANSDFARNVIEPLLP